MQRITAQRSVLCCAVLSHSVVSYSLRPHGLEPTRFLCPWGFFRQEYQSMVAIWLSGKESACNTGNPGSIPGSGRSPEEGIGYPLWYSWASLVAQMVKNPPAMQETWVRSLGWEDPLEEGMSTQFIILSWRIPMDRGAWQTTVHGVTESQTQLSN